MNILVTLDSGYINQLCTMLRSLVSSNSDEHITLYVAHSSLTDADFAKIQNAIDGSDCEYKSIKLDNTLFSNASTKKRITKETYYRLFAPLFLPESVDRVLYIDPDTVVINSLKDFYYTDFGSNVIVGAKHFTGLIDIWNRKRLFMRKSPRYINAGVILMNIEELRKDFSPERIHKVVAKKLPRLFLADQDALNILYDGKIKVYDEYKINLDERAFSRKLKEMSLEEALEMVKSSTMIIHYDGKFKPWHDNYEGNLQDFYLQYNNID